LNAVAIEWSLRTAQPDDAGAISALLGRSYPLIWKSHYAPDMLAAVLPLVTRANPSLLASGRFFVAMAACGELAVGCGGWSAQWPGSERADPCISHARHFATDTRWLRKGIGQAILDRCAKDAKAAGFVMMLADAARGAEPFYAASGFEPAGLSSTVIGGTPVPGTMMKRLL
jgi:GNAT superfamily N-acetyltransferase